MPYCDERNVCVWPILVIFVLFTDQAELPDGITRLQQLISQSSIPGSESVVCLKEEDLQIDYNSCVGMGCFGAVYNAVLRYDKRVCVKLFYKKTPIKETIVEGILLNILNTSGATPWSYGIVALHENTNFHPFGLVQEVIECGIEGRQTLTLKELLYFQNDKEQYQAPNWSNLKAKLRQRLELVCHHGIEISDISLKNTMLRWNGECYMPFFIDMGKAIGKYSNDPCFKPENDRKKLENIFRKYFPKPCCISM